jgi:hypothetical protein
MMLLQAGYPYRILSTNPPARIHQHMGARLLYVYWSPLYYVLAPKLCNVSQKDAIKEGFAVIKDYMLTSFTANQDFISDGNFSKQTEASGVLSAF